MDKRLEDLRSAKNPKARIKILKGHFATSHSHINTYIDMSTVKSRHNNARETAKVLAAAYLSNTTVDTIVCMEETEVIGTFLAEQLADENQYSLSKGNNISIITPEMYQDGQILFRDNKQRMVENKQVLILAASITTGKSVKQAIESVLYYGGRVCGTAQFSVQSTRLQEWKSIRSSQAVIFRITEHILRKIARSAEKDSGSKLS